MAGEKASQKDSYKTYAWGPAAKSFDVPVMLNSPEMTVAYSQNCTFESARYGERQKRASGAAIKLQQQKSI